MRDGERANFAISAAAFCLAKCLLELCPNVLEVEPTDGPGQLREVFLSFPLLERAPSTRADPYVANRVLVVVIQQQIGGELTEVLA
jgi:hypothetical protein